MKVYLAACFEQQEEIKAKADELAALGIHVTSRWRFEDSSLPETPERFDQCARVDLEDIRDADYLVVLTDQTSQRGGKHVETGYALGLGKPVMIVGRKENVFHYLKRGIVNVANWQEAVAKLISVVDAMSDKAAVGGAA